MYSGYSALSIDFLSKPSQTSSSNSGNWMYNTQYNAELLSLNSDIRSNRGEESNVYDNFRQISFANEVTNFPVSETDLQTPTSIGRRSLDSVYSPDSSITGMSDDGNDSQMKDQVHSPYNSTQSGGEEVESPTMQRYSSKSVKSPSSINAFKKPSQNYIQIISMAILGNKQQKVQLFEIYNFFEKKYPYFKHAKSASWQNSVRHNLSLNECFIKCGRSDNGKGNFWTVHPACVSDFKKGDFRRRQARRRAKRGAFKQTIEFSTPQGNPIASNATSPIDKYSISDLQHQIPSPYQNIPAGYTLPGLQNYTRLPYNAYTNGDHNNGCYSQTYLSSPYHFPSPYHLPGEVGTTTTGSHSTSVSEGIHQGHGYSDIHQHSSGLSHSGLSPLYYSSGLKCKNMNTNSSNYTHRITTAGPPNINAANLNLGHSGLYSNIVSNSRECFGIDEVQGFIKGNF